MAEDENQSFFFQREICSFHNYDQFGQENLIIQQQMSNNSYNVPCEQFQQQNQESYKIDDKMEQEMQIEDLTSHHQQFNIDTQQQQQPQQQHPISQQSILSNPHFNLLQHQQLQQQQQPLPNQQLNYSQQQQQQQQQLQSSSNPLIQNHSLSSSQSPPTDPMSTGPNRTQNNYLKSEEAGRNYPLLANILDESQQNIKLNEFYIQNKVLQGLNCFMLLDNELPRHAAGANNFCDDPNFFLGHIFDEKNKNGMFSEVNNHLVKSDNGDALKTSYQSPQQGPIAQNQQINQNKQDHVTKPLNQHSLEQQQQQQPFVHNSNNNIQSNINQQQQQIPQSQSAAQNQNQNQNLNIRLDQMHQFNQYENDEQQFLHDFISGYIQQNTHQNFMNHQDDYQNNHQQHYQQGHHGSNQNQHNHNHDGSNKGPSKNAFQRSSTSFLDKVTFAVDDFLDKQDPNEFPELSSGEDFLMTNLRNYIALEFSYNQESSYFQKYLNSSYQIFLQRLKLLIDQKRMDSKTLLPFVCRFSIEMAEKLLQFIYKCDDKFTMKIFREQSYFSKENPSSQKDPNGSTSPTTHGSQHSQRFDSSIIDDDYSQVFKNVDSNNISPIQPSLGQQQNYQKNNYNAYNQTHAQPQLGKPLIPQNNQGYSAFGIQQNIIPSNNLMQSQQHLNNLPQQVQQPQYQNLNENNDFDEEDEDQLPFPVQKSSLFDIGKAQRKQWKKSEIVELMTKYREYQQKIPPLIMEELTKKFNRSIQSIQSKIQKLRKNHNMQISDMMSEYSQNFVGQSLSHSQNSSAQNSSLMSTMVNKNIQDSANRSTCNNGNIGMMQVNGNPNQANMMKIESKLKNCLFELDNQRGTKNQILKKMKERFYSNTMGGQSSAWETSAKQLLSSQSFQRRKGIFQLKDDVQIINLDATDSSSYKQKLIYTLSQLPDRKGTLEEIVSLYLKKFGNETDQRKIKENIQKVLNQYSDCFDKSQSKTTYYLTPQEIQLISQEIQSQNNMQQTTSSQNENQMFSQPTLQSRCSRLAKASEGNGIHLPLLFLFFSFSFIYLYSHFSFFLIKKFIIYYLLLFIIFCFILHFFRFNLAILSSSFLLNILHLHLSAEDIDIIRRNILDKQREDRTKNQDYYYLLLRTFINTSYLISQNKQGGCEYYQMLNQYYFIIKFQYNKNQKQLQKGVQSTQSNNLIIFIQNIKKILSKVDISRKKIFLVILR